MNWNWRELAWMFLVFTMISCYADLDAWGDGLRWLSLTWFAESIAEGVLVVGALYLWHYKVMAQRAKDAV